MGVAYNPSQCLGEEPGIEGVEDGAGPGHSKVEFHMSVFWGGEGASERASDREVVG